MRRWSAFLFASALLAGACTQRDEVAEIDAALADVQRGQAALAAEIEQASAALLEKQAWPVRRSVIAMGHDVERLRKMTGELRQVSVKELTAYRAAIAGRSDADIARQRMAHMDVAIATAEHLSVEVRMDVTEGGDPTLRRLAQSYNESLAGLGRTVASIRAILKAQRELLAKARPKR